ncbi:Do family serine endopeptidase [Jiella endophytica]|uniref:Probable periplasmic serine endoprotease DegP-like n=1 Tax=Jiella endophytica TaxID=2558362 RepID=A0A4Y8RKA8_9HYPH|nr:Do family serine endopeptidase [Jiella endophytica]TFF22961.1 Do family serine endopeptidase [Jiella endophytica]
MTAKRVETLFPVLLIALLAGSAPLGGAAAQTTGGEAPKAEAPEALVPEIQAPDAQQPDIPVPDTQAPAAQAPGAGTPGAAENAQNAAPAAPAQPDAPATSEQKVPALPVPPTEGGATTKTQAPAATASRPTRYGPTSVADLADRLLDAVVNVSTSQGVEQPGRGVPPLKAPEGSPLQDFFDDLLREKDGPGERSVQSLGSGFVIDPSGLIVTNNHVIGDADTITVNFPNGDQLDAELLGKDSKTDLALLKVDADKPLPFVNFGDSEDLRIGDWVMAIGNPFGLGGSVSIGIVSARGRNINAGPYDNFIQTDAAINRGNSGGPLFDMFGNVVGINTAIISPTGGSIGIGFSIPSNLAVNVIDQLREYGETRRGWLGIRLQALNEDIAKGLGIDQHQGAVVMGIVPGGPSDNGTLKVGDVIVSFDGRKVEGSNDLPRMVAETKVGKKVRIGILRKEQVSAPAKPSTVEITLGRLEDGEKLMAETEDGPKPQPDAADKSSEGVEALGMSLSDIDDAARKKFDLPDDVAGAVVTAVKANSPAAEKGVEVGMTITEVAQETVSSAAEVKDKIAKLKDEGRRNALLLLTATNGDVRFVVVPID